ncbi:MAG: pantoate--beta-alanine ligase [Chloroflexota bacterium]
MDVVQDIATIRRLRWADPTLSWGLVPTMGYLHAGHLALVEQARAKNDRVAATIFVNPTQFAANEDLSDYPRSLEQDLTLLEAAGTDLVFTPTDTIMYPPKFQTTVSLKTVTQPLEGASRPTHFQGVATVVAKLFNIIQPTRAYFGQKDAQQTVVIQQMVADLNFNLDVIICPTVREADGLAMSSRNTYLTAEQRSAAPILYQALSQAEMAFKQGERDATILRQMMQNTLTKEPLANIDYLSVADPLTLVELSTIEHGALLSVAVFFGHTRLIDNVLVGV